MSSVGGGACLSTQEPPNGKLDERDSQQRAFGLKSLRGCGEIGRIAALQGRPVIGSIQFLGDADPIDWASSRIPRSRAEIYGVRPHSRVVHGINKGSCSGHTEA